METNISAVASKSDAFIRAIMLAHFVSVIFIHFIFDYMKIKFTAAQSISTNDKFVEEIKQSIDNAKKCFLLICFGFCCSACVFISPLI